MVHNHVNVRSGNALFTEGSLVAGDLGVLLLGGSSFSSRLGLGRGKLAFSELSGLSLLQAGVGIFKLEFSEDGKGFTVTFRSEDLWVVNDEDKAVSLSKSYTGDTGELLHANLEEGLTALFFTAVKLGTI
mgnify:CR=1 FL=1